MQLSRLPATTFLTGVMMVFALTSSFAPDAYAQDIIGYSESEITVKSERTYCGSRNFEMTDVLVKDAGRNAVENIAPGSQITVEASALSNCEIKDYPIIVLFEVRDADGSTKYFAYQNVTTNAGDAITTGFSWLPEYEGDYRLRIILHACLPCSGDFGIMEWLDFSVLNQPAEEGAFIDLAIAGLQSTYAVGERIIFNVNAKGVSDNTCNIGSPSVYMRDDSNGKTIYWPNPFGFNTAMGCAGPEPIDREWTFGDDAESEIILEEPGSYSVIASLEDVTIEKQFSVE